jgi:integrase
MATIKVKFRPSTKAGGEGILFYQIIQERKTRRLMTAYHLMPAEWDERRSTVKSTSADGRASFIISVRERIRRDVDRLSRIVRRLEGERAGYTADDVAEEFRRYSSAYTLVNYMEGIIARLKSNGKIRTSETYASTLNSFRRFLSETEWRDCCVQPEDVMLDRLDTDIMEAFEAWHHQRGATPNTISFYLRILRAVYNRAVEDNIVEDRHPFRRVYTGNEKTAKRALPLQIVRKINALELSLAPSLDYARDMFMLSFMLRGMSFIDMAYLRKTDLQHGYIVYRRRKTGQRLMIAWTPDMQRILDKYPENPTGYLLPIIRNPAADERTIYRNIGYNINRNLKMIGKQVGVEEPLTLYVARHSWATVAKSKGIPISIISEGMGHDSEQTTRIYLSTLDTSAVDKANATILGSL